MFARAVQNTQLDGPVQPFKKATSVAWDDTTPTTTPLLPHVDAPPAPDGEAEAADDDSSLWSSAEEKTARQARLSTRRVTAFVCIDAEPAEAPPAHAPSRRDLVYFHKRVLPASSTTPTGRLMRRNVVDTKRVVVIHTPASATWKWLALAAAKRFQVLPPPAGTLRHRDQRDHMTSCGDQSLFLPINISTTAPGQPQRDFHHPQDNVWSGQGGLGKTTSARRDRLATAGESGTSGTGRNVVWVTLGRRLRFEHEQLRVLLPPWAVIAFAVGRGPNASRRQGALAAETRFQAELRRRAEEAQLQREREQAEARLARIRWILRHQIGLRGDDDGKETRARQDRLIWKATWMIPSDADRTEVAGHLTNFLPQLEEVFRYYSTLDMQDGEEARSMSFLEFMELLRDTGSFDGTPLKARGRPRERCCGEGAPGSGVPGTA